MAVLGRREEEGGRELSQLCREEVGAVAVVQQ